MKNESLTENLHLRVSPSELALLQKAGSKFIRTGGRRAYGGTGGISKLVRSVAVPAAAALVKVESISFLEVKK